MRAVKAHCAICNLPLTDFFSDYPNPVCDECDQRAVNVDGEKPKFYSMWDDGDNPVFIDGRKCWRRYRFGGYVTMLDKHDSQDILEFCSKVSYRLDDLTFEEKQKILHLLNISGRIDSKRIYLSGCVPSWESEKFDCRTFEPDQLP